MKPSTPSQRAGRELERKIEGTLRVGVIALALGGTLTCVSDFANANPFNNEPPRELVEVRDLNLAKPEGAQTLCRRVKMAATRVCRKSHPRGLGYSFVEFRDCKSKAIENALAEMPNTIQEACGLRQFRVATTR